MKFIDKLEAYADEISHESRLKKISQRLRNNPKNKVVIKKLEQLYIERERLKKDLEKKETEIDFCLLFLHKNDLE